jgi:hypothetical protein
MAFSLVIAAPILNGFPHFEGLATTTPFAGFVQPFLRLIWKRIGMLKKHRRRCQ